MRKKYFSAIACLSFLALFNVNAQERLSDLDYGSVIENYLQRNAAKYKLSSNDLSDLIVSSTGSTNSGLKIAYVNQAYQGIKIDNAVSTIAVKSNEVFSYADNFIGDLSSKVNTAVPSITAEEAIKIVLDKYNVGTPQRLIPVVSFAPAKNKYSFVDKTIAQDEMDAELMYHYDEASDKLNLTWKVGVYTLDSQNYHSANIDAQSGKVLGYFDKVIKCSFDVEGEEAHDHSEHLDEQVVGESSFTLFKSSNVAAAEKAKYNVFVLPVESPNFGKRSVIDSPNYKYSPEGWHKNGSSGTTKGNNVNAYEDTGNKNRPGYQPKNSSLNFDYEINFNKDPSSYQDAAITNLFYASNMVHDTFYRYGFDEENGNFQNDNFRNGGAGSDAVNCEAQDGSGKNNANFMTPNDGRPGRMQMYTWDRSRPKRDGDLDNSVVCHEYGHGISTRLTGGRNNSGCLDNKEQMGEGWSDWVAMILTMTKDQEKGYAKGMGTYVFGEDKNGKGIRQYKYSTDMKICPGTYDEIKKYTSSSPHPIGTVWNTILWDLNFAYVEKYGFDPDFVNGNGGNNKVMQVVVDGMKLQKCNPGFVSGRDAILKADMALTDGKDQCMIWEVFARRGVGHKAKEGSTSSVSDGRENFDMPPADDPTLQNCTSTSVDDFSKASYSVFPNPTTGLLTIEADENYGDAKVSLVDINGRVVLSKSATISTEKLQLNISGLASGVYILNIKGQSINTFDKIIKE